MTTRAGIEPLLSANVVLENAAEGTVVGLFQNFDPDPSKTFRYSLPHDWDGPFKIVGNQLVVANGSWLDYESIPTYSIDVEVTSSTGELLIKTFTIRIQDVIGAEPPPPINQAPIDIVLTGNTVAENSPSTSAVGYFTASDPNGDPLRYTLLDDAGGRFKLHDDTIIVADGALLDYETHPSHEVRVRVTDIHGASYDKTFTIFVRDMNEDPHIPENPPTDIVLSSRIVAENSEAGTAVGYLYTVDPNSGENFTYTLVDDADGRFAIVGNKLVVAGGTSLDYETHQTHGIRIRVTDAQGLSYEENFTILVKDVDEAPAPPPANHAPTGLLLTGAAVEENAPMGRLIGSFVAWDPDSGESFTYTLLDDAGGRFAIEDGKLVVANDSLIDYETSRAHEITVRVTDSHGASLDKSFTISVVDTDDTEEAPANTPPSMVMLDGVSVVENAGNGTAIGRLRAHDPDEDALTFSLLDNADGRFAIRDGVVVVADGSRLDYETAPSHQILVRVTDDHGAHRDAVFTIHVRDTVDRPSPLPLPGSNAPVDLALSGDGIAENAARGSVVGILATFDPDASESFSYALLNDAGGRFKLSGSQIVVADGIRLDFEKAQTHTVTVRVTDSSGLSLTKDLAIAVKDVAEEVISGTKGNDIIAGGTGHDRLFGGRGNDKLYGDAGKDVISGGLGNDLMSGGRGKDAFLFDTKLGKSNVDRIADFSVKDDTIHLARSVFTGLAKKGVLSKDVFWKGTKAQDANDRIGYDAESGNVYYDADGSGAGRAVKIANIGKDLTKLSHLDFLVF